MEATSAHGLHECIHFCLPGVVDWSSSVKIVCESAAESYNCWHALSAASIRINWFCVSANRIPSEGYVLEIDGKFKTEFETSEAAMKAALELKKKYPPIQVNVYDAKEHTRTLVEPTGKSAVSVSLV